MTHETRLNTIFTCTATAAIGLGFLAYKFFQLEYAGAGHGVFCTLGAGIMAGIALNEFLNFGIFEEHEAEDFNLWDME